METDENTVLVNEVRKLKTILFLHLRFFVLPAQNHLRLNMLLCFMTFRKMYNILLN